MPLKKMAKFRRDDYSYTSPDGDEWEITIIQTEDRKYVEIKKGDEVQVQWDIEMLLDIADAVRRASQKPSAAKPHGLRRPQVTDRRDGNETPSDMIQTSVDESMGNIDDSVRPVESFTHPNMTEDIARRSQGAAEIPDTSRIKRS